jgi:hypothetical protein
MTYERIALRLTQRDRENLSALAAALNESQTQNRPWERGASVTRCLRLALSVAADAVRQNGMAVTKVSGPCL